MTETKQALDAVVALVEKWRGEAGEYAELHSKQTGYEINWEYSGRSDALGNCAADLAALLPALTAYIHRIQSSPPSYDNAVRIRQLEEQVEQLQAALGEGWQPIESAPRDGTEILLSNGRTTQQGWWVHDEGGTVEYRDSDGRYIDQDDSDGFVGWFDVSGCMVPPPTDWRPLPPPPAIDAVAAGEDAK